MAATTNKVAAIDYSIVNKAVTKANKNKSINQHKEAAKLARKAAKKATEEGNYHLANHYHKIYEHHNEMANMRKSETKDNPRDMGKTDKHGTQKAEERKPFDRLNTQYVKSAFNLGDKVRSIHNPNMIGEVSHVGPYDDFLGTHRYKVLEPNGRRHFWTGTGMTKISDEEHAKGTPYYKPTQKSETETRLAVLAKGIQAAITLRGLVKAEKEASKDRYIVRFNDGKSASKKEFTKKGAAHSHAQKKIDEGYDNVTLHHYSVDNPTKETKLEIKSSSGGNK